MARLHRYLEEEVGYPKGDQPEGDNKEDRCRKDLAAVGFRALSKPPPYPQEQQDQAP